jgi:hypothetical protein
MKKLTVLMIFVLLFSITTLAGNLSKEEIINELEKITIVANKDNRLEMYDILAKKLGLKIANDSIIKSYSGNGTQTTRPFVVKTSWEMQWDTKAEDFMLFQVYLYDGDGNLVNIVANQTKPGKGSCYNPKGGTFYLNINAVADWEIKIVEIE